ncbi:hydroxyacid dehydrogenase [Roseospira marina]|uniref:Hydroxyacid dehydrogenase n=1 Tax=Roseospira marina TaxID=140057 RepID=A0A5M6I8V5_9PROT|nr:NAD(P)-dependent oxidoreductase [Roseospira marina]KAA5604189.1 hydroxyacid dehydrogenase [Roseospira marina]MBB4315715.1 D-3-phosphoglycerate dehydrogenase [Roseospira marina]MBB5088827.1 D-3-phosphoglycerate dehydrogenase [Roseospira marina]
MTTIATTSPGFGRYGRVPTRIKENGWEFIRCADSTKPDGGLSDCIDRIDFLVAGLVAVTGKTLDAAPKLKAVLKHGVGVDSIDIPACTARGIPVLNTPGANANAVAELALGMMFALARNIPGGHKSVVEGGWDRQAGFEIDGKTLGIVGLGNIGRMLAAKAQALGMTVVATDPYADPAFVKELGIELLDLEALLARSDIVSLHVFGGAANTNLINADTLKLMKKTACLLNLARGEVVDLDALDAALAAGALGGAGIDAYTVEPPDRSHPIFSRPSVVFTPHSGADTLEALERVGLMNVADIEEMLAGGRPKRVLNPEVFNTAAE